MQESRTAWDLVERRDYAGALEQFQLITARRNPRLLGDSHFMQQAFCFWCLGYPMEAVAVLRHALITSYQAPGAGAEPIGLLLYAAERLHDAQIRREALAALRKHARRAHHGGPSAPAPYLLGLIDEAEFRERMLRTVSDERDRCMYEFFIGVRALSQANRDTFANRMRRAADVPGRAHMRPEHHLAQ